MSIKCDSKLLVKPLFFLVIVDTINGFFLNKGMESSIGIIFKAFILSVAFKILCSSPRFKGLLFFTVIYIPAFLLLVILNTDSQIVPTINHLLKFVNVVFIYYAAVVVFKSESIQEKDIQVIFYINSIVLLLNIYSQGKELHNGWMHQSIIKGGMMNLFMAMFFIILARMKICLSWV